MKTYEYNGYDIITILTTYYDSTLLGHQLLSLSYYVFKFTISYHFIWFIQ